MINVAFEFDESQTVELMVTDVIGQQMQRINAQQYRTDNLQIDLNGYANGIYYLVFYIDGLKVVKKVVKMN